MKLLLACALTGLVLSLVGGGAAIFANGSRNSALPPIRSVAVLPFANLSGDSAQQLFADGMPRLTHAYLTEG